MGFGWRTCNQLKQKLLQCSGTGSQQHKSSVRESQAARGRVSSAGSIGMPSASHSTPGARGGVLCSLQQALLR